MRGIGWLHWILLGLTACVSGAPSDSLIRAAANGDVERVETLLNDGREVDAVDDDDGWTALHWAARGDHAYTVRLLAARGADIDAMGEVNGWTPLMHAIHTRAQSASRELIEYGADLEKRSHSGSTPLILAAGYGNTVIVRALLAHGADPYAEAGNGVTALWAAAGGGALVDFTDGPPLGTCFPETIEVLLAEAPNLRLPENASTEVIEWLGGLKGCGEVIAELKVE